MLLILIGFTFWSAVLIGLGTLPRPWLGRHLDDLSDLPIAFWIGWALAILLLQLVNFVLPIRPWGAVVVIALGVLGLALHRQEIRQLVARQRRPPLVVLLVIAALAVFVALRSTAPLIEGDSGEYHLGSVAWSSAYPLVRGLGNLLPRLAFNQSFFLYGAMLDLGPFVGNSYQLANGLLLVQIVALGVLSLRRVVSAPRDGAPRWMFFALMLAPALHQMNDERFFSLSPDSAPFLLGIVLLGECLDILLRPEGGVEVRDVARVTLLGAAGVACKQSFLAFGLSAVFIIWLAWLWQHRRLNLRARILELWPALVIGVVIAGGWIARGLLLSGYPFFPTTALPLSVAWRVPPDTALGELNWIVMRARNPAVSPDQITPGMAWLANWLRSLPNSITKPAEVSAALLLFTLALWPGRAGAQHNARRVLVLTAIPLVSIAYWLVTAPAPRFAGSAFWALLGLLILGFVLVAGLMGGDHGPAVFAVIALTFFVWVAPLAPWKISLNARTLIDARRSGRIPEYSAQVTHTGLAVNVPTSEDECWDTPLPCTTHFSERLALLEPGNLAGGFRRLPEAPP